MRPWRRQTHAAPSEHCDCGIYACCDLAEAAAYLEGFHRPGGRVVHHVIGRVSLWGSVIECRRGWRASCAYPAHIWVPTLRASREAAAAAEEIALELADYGVPIEILECTTREEVIAALDRNLTTPPDALRTGLRPLAEAVDPADVVPRKET